MSVVFVAVIVNGPMLLPSVGLLSGLVCGEFGLARSLMCLGLAQPNVLFFVAVLFGASRVFGLAMSINGVFNSSSDGFDHHCLFLFGR